MKKRYEYHQNNSGGSFITPKWTGTKKQGGVFSDLAGDDGKCDVWVMAESADEANYKAKKYAGVYFDGCDQGIDCECCGDRWYRK